MQNARRYTAVAGDYLVLIAQAHDVTWQEIWHHPQNATHRRLRGSPELGTEPREANERRLSNLGFVGGETLNANVLAFQRHFELPLSGELDDIGHHLRQSPQ